MTDVRPIDRDLDQVPGQSVLPLKRRRALLLAIVCASGVGTVSVYADGDGPWQRLGRITGWGHGDGYSACRSSGCQPLANLPPLTYAAQYPHGAPAVMSSSSEGHGSLHSGSYYDRVDAMHTYTTESTSLIAPPAHTTPNWSESVLDRTPPSRLQREEVEPEVTPPAKSVESPRKEVSPRSEDAFPSPSDREADSLPAPKTASPDTLTPELEQPAGPATQRLDPLDDSLLESEPPATSQWLDEALDESQLPNETSPQPASEDDSALLWSDSPSITSQSVPSGGASIGDLPAPNETPQSIIRQPISNPEVIPAPPQSSPGLIPPASPNSTNDSSDDLLLFLTPPSNPHSTSEENLAEESSRYNSRRAAVVKPLPKPPLPMSLRPQAEKSPSMAKVHAIPQSFFDRVAAIPSATATPRERVFNPVRQPGIEEATPTPPASTRHFIRQPD